MSIVGPGSVTEQGVRPDPTLQGASQYEVVKILNPLSDDFSIQVAQTRPVDVPYTIKPGEPGKENMTESEAGTKFGLSLRGPDQHMASKKHIINRTVIKAGTSMNFSGDVAQVAVKQLVDYIMQKEGQKKFMADPVRRKEFEDRIIMARGSMDDLMNNSLQTVESQISQAIEKSNEVQNEEAFPDIDSGDGRPESSPTVSDSDKAESSRGKKTS